MAGLSELARAKWVSKLVATDEVIRSVLLDAEPEKVDAVFRSVEVKQLLSQLLEVSDIKQPASSAKKGARGRRRKKKSSPVSASSPSSSTASISASSSSSSSSLLASPTKKKSKKKKTRQKKKKKANARTNKTSTGSNTSTIDTPAVAPRVDSPQHMVDLDVPLLSSEDEMMDDERDLDKTVYWNELNHPFGGNTPNGFSDNDSGSGGNSNNSRTSSNNTPISANSGSGGGISDQESSPHRNESPRGRRVSFAEDVWVQEIPKVDQSLIKDLFYSEADIDDMYQEAEDEVLNATVPMTANGVGNGGELGSEKGGGGFNSTI